MTETHSPRLCAAQARWLGQAFARFSVCSLEEHRDVLKRLCDVRRDNGVRLQNMQCLDYLLHIKLPMDSREISKRTHRRDANPRIRIDEKPKAEALHPLPVRIVVGKPRKSLGSRISVSVCQKL